MADAPGSQPTSPASSSSSPSSTSTPRARKRLRQQANQRRREANHDALLAFQENPTFGNGLRAWLAETENSSGIEDFRSAQKFARAMRSLLRKSSGQPDYPETARVSADAIVDCVDDLAWSLNVKFTMRDDAKDVRTPTSRVGKNFRSLIDFLAKANAFTHADFSYLLTECKALEEDLDRTARVNRIMEQYAWYVQEAYFDEGRIVDETYRGEYEVERISGPRLLVLREYNPEGDVDMGDTPLRSFTTYFPVPLVQRMRRGDVLVLQLCHLQQNGVWVPYMYSGFTPCRDDGGTVTPTERQVRIAAPHSGRNSSVEYEHDAAGALSQSLQRLDLSSRQRSVDRVGGRQATRSRTPQRSSILGMPQAAVTSSTAPPSPGAGLDFNFDELKYTDGYFSAWEGDIDTDEDFGDVLRSPDEETAESGELESGVNLYGVLRERHQV